jgi:hypothetical protein
MYMSKNVYFAGQELILPDTMEEGAITASCLGDYLKSLHTLFEMVDTQEATVSTHEVAVLLSPAVTMSQILRCADAPRHTEEMPA